MPIVRGPWAELLAPGLNMNTFGAYQQWPELFSQVVNVKNSTKAYEDNFDIAGFGPLSPKGELEPTILDEPIKLGGVRYIHRTYALGFAISREMRDDAQYPAMMQLAGELGKSSRYTSELYGHDVLNNGFSTSKYVGRDGKALFATDHPIEGTGATIGNRPAVDVDLSSAALEAGVSSYRLQVDERGMPIIVNLRQLIFNPTQEMFVRRLLESPRVTGSNNNDINVFFNMGITPVSDPYFLDQDAWVLSAGPGNIDVNFWWRERPDTKTWDDDNADATFHKIRQRHSTGFGNWRGMYGSPGA